ncbi:hypothetical protein [Angustibacter luteus]|uniref:Uncharacterized protein n=1 Tax=Angustibacter luteus TaxID=658456 RepID=A0ABW1JDJ0_9ACTN
MAAITVLAGCNHSGQAAPVQSRPSTTTKAPIPGGQLPKAAPAFTAHFSDPVYEDPAGEFAPFGTDEGSDMLSEWDERREELGPDTTVTDLLEDAGLSDVSADLDNPEDVDAATITVAAGFTLLRLSGRIDDAGKKLTLKALDVLIRYYDSPSEVLRQRADLKSWRG